MTTAAIADTQIAQLAINTIRTLSMDAGARSRVAIEQASAFGWERYVSLTGRVIGMHTFGASAPLKALLTEYGFTVEKVVAAAKAQVAQVPQS